MTRVLPRAAFLAALPLALALGACGKGDQTITTDENNNVVANESQANGVTASGSMAGDNMAMDNAMSGNGMMMENSDTLGDLSNGTMSGAR
ncbi:hypothetical protein KZ813_12415 [Sphingomonas sp. RHCKR7]|uniref:hypothetical protein n=1 Tax=Sphingomonas folli TaxID=2862497 RepID=UPI001CA484C0|nr:hypothetical protein [Sphingomonas folli]MBW6527647.1 hypothetical protein [Sphingomonas folli]